MSKPKREKVGVEPTSNPGLDSALEKVIRDPNVPIKLRAQACGLQGRIEQITQYKLELRSLHDDAQSLALKERRLTYGTQVRPAVGRGVSSTGPELGNKLRTSQECESHFKLCATVLKRAKQHARTEGQELANNLRGVAAQPNDAVADPPSADHAALQSEGPQDAHSAAVTLDVDR